MFSLLWGMAAAGEIAWSGHVPLHSNAASDSASDVSPQLAYNGSDAWIAVWVAGNGADLDVFFARSVDNGATWSAPSTLNSNAGSDDGDDLTPQLAWSGKSTCVVVWHSKASLEGAAGGEGDILFSRSTDNGVTWSAPAPIDPGASSDEFVDISPDIASDNKGVCVVVWDLGKDIVFSRSADGGGTWSAAAPISNNADTDELPQVETDGAGNWIAAWRSDTTLGGTIGTDFDVLYARSADNGATWSTPVALNANAATDTGLDGAPSIDTDSAGMWMAVWSTEDTLGGTIGADRDVAFAVSADNGATWTNPSALNSDAATDSLGDFDPKLRSDKKGNWAVVWYSTKGAGASADSDVDVYSSVSSNGGASWTPIASINPNAGADTGNDFSPSIGSDGSGLWLSVWESTEVVAKAADDWDIHIAKGAFTGSLAGVVRSSLDNSGLSCAALLIESAPLGVERVAGTDINGEYEVNGLPESTYTVTVFSPGFAETTAHVEVAANATTTRDFALSATSGGGGVRGTVTDETTSEPLLGVRVDARIGGQLVQSTYTCAEGQYEMTGLVAKATEVTLDFTTDSHDPATVTVQVDAGAIEQADAQLTPKSLAPGGLAGTIERADSSEPIPSARVTLTGRIDVTATADTSGVYSFPSLPEGLYSARASAPGFEGETAPATVTALDIAQLDFQLSPASASPEDINGDSAVDAVDVQLVINGALSIPTGFNCDIDNDADVDAVDVQLVINAALGLKTESAVRQAAGHRSGVRTSKSAAPAGTIYWIAGEDSDKDWNNPSNWSTGLVPANADIVVISRPGLELAVTIPSGFHVVSAITCDEDFSMTAGALTTLGDSRFTGPFTLAPGTTFAVSGAGTVCDITNEFVTLDGATISAYGGSVVNLPTVTGLTNTYFQVRSGSIINLPLLSAYEWNAGNTNFFNVAGTGSQLNVGALTFLTVSGGTHGIIADAGGHIDLSSLATPTVLSGLGYYARNGGTIDLSALTLSANSAFDVRGGSTMSLPALTTIDGNSMYLSGAGSTLSLPAFTSLINVGIEVYSGAVLDLPSVTAYTWSLGNANFFSVSGSGSLLNLPNLTSLTLSGGSHGMISDSGAQINLSSLTATTVVSSLGYFARNGGTIDLSGLTSSPNSAFDVRGGSTLSLPSLIAIDGNSVYLSGLGSTLSLPAFTSLTNVAIQVYSGAVLDLPSVTSYTWSLGNANFFSVSGSGAQLNLPNLTSLTLSGGTHGIISDSNGHIDLSSLAVPNVLTGLSYYARNGGTIDLSALTSSANSAFDVRGGSTLSLPSLTTIDGNSVYVSGLGSTLTVPAFTSLTNVAIQVYSGAVLDLPSVTSYTWSLSNAYFFTVSGPGSQLNLPGLASLTVSGGSHGIVSDSGGHIDLSSLAVPNVLTGLAYYVRNGGTIDLSGLTSSPKTAFDVRGGSTLSLPAVTTIDGNSVYLSGLGSTLALPPITSLTNTDIQVHAGAVFSLAPATSYTWSLGNATFFLADGAGSLLDLSGITSIGISGGSNVINAANGAQIDLSSAQTVTSAAGTNLALTATGTGSQIDVTSLTTFDPARVMFNEVNGGVVLRP